MKTEEEYFSLAQIKIAKRFDNGERVGLKDVCIEALKLQKADIESSSVELKAKPEIAEIDIENHPLLGDTLRQWERIAEMLQECGSIVIEKPSNFTA